MKTLFQPITFESVIKRIEKLQFDSQRLWGKMNVSQMMAHCSISLEAAMGKFKPKRMFMGRLIGKFVKSSLTDEKPMMRNASTAKSYLVSTDKEFEKEKTKLLDLLNEFHHNGESGVTTHPHAFFGKLTPDEWSAGMYKHLDHHLRQFGV